MKITTDYTGKSYTESGTRVLQQGQDTLDKNAFLTILAAELSNQDPTSNVDSTQYISQLAQFTSLEQMTNLNDTMTNSANRNLVGMGATVSDKDASGKQYTGIIAAVTSQNGTNYISMIVNENNENVYKDFPISHIQSVVQVADSNIALNSSINASIQYMFASSLIGQDVQITDVDSDGKAKDPVYGTVQGAYRDANGVVNVNVKLESGETKAYSYDKVTQVGNCKQTADEQSK